jgi:hypothetical protein
MKSDGKNCQICIRMELFSGMVHSCGSPTTIDQENVGMLSDREPSVFSFAFRGVREHGNLDLLSLPGAIAMSASSR